MDDLKHILSLFNPISLEDMDRVALQNRTDTKFVFEVALLPKILNDILPYYFILEIKKKRTNDYKTLYYDTEDLKSYLEHHNGKGNRLKVRCRKYIDSNLHFLEVKYKNNKRRTIKSRLKVNDFETNLSAASKQFISNNSTYTEYKLTPILWNSFTRLTLVHKTKKERLTIDINMEFTHFSSKENKVLKNIVVAEVKQEKASGGSDFIQAIKKYHIRKSSMSKYCVGTALLNKNIKRNNFKERILKINKLNYA
ncbi:MAG: polyphosphate polymerase domain-containing protein [Vicingus serpentipes]|nr:polyphosphate polymerase domain-containing protein [Vicingus serpentipes]